VVSPTFAFSNLSGHLRSFQESETGINIETNSFTTSLDTLKALLYLRRNPQSVHNNKHHGWNGKSCATRPLGFWNDHDESHVRTGLDEYMKREEIDQTWRMHLSCRVIRSHPVLLPWSLRIFMQVSGIGMGRRRIH
jgi:hypothetical protein